MLLLLGIGESLCGGCGFPGCYGTTTLLGATANSNVYFGKLLDSVAGTQTYVAAPAGNGAGTAELVAAGFTAPDTDTSFFPYDRSRGGTRLVSTASYVIRGDSFAASYIAIVALRKFVSSRLGNAGL
jgi:hypothetical protein